MAFTRSDMTFEEWYTNYCKDSYPDIYIREVGGVDAPLETVVAPLSWTGTSQTPELNAPTSIINLEYINKSNTWIPLDFTTPFYEGMPGTIFDGNPYPIIDENGVAAANGWDVHDVPNFGGIRWWSKYDNYGAFWNQTCYYKITGLPFINGYHSPLETAIKEAGFSTGGDIHAYTGYPGLFDGRPLYFLGPGETLPFQVEMHDLGWYGWGPDGRGPHYNINTVTVDELPPGHLNFQVKFPKIIYMHHLYENSENGTLWDRRQCNIMHPNANNPTARINVNVGETFTFYTRTDRPYIWSDNQNNTDTDVQQRFYYNGVEIDEYPDSAGKGGRISPSGIPPGSSFFEVECTVRFTSPMKNFPLFIFCGTGGILGTDYRGFLVFNVSGPNPIGTVELEIVSASLERSGEAPYGGPDWSPQIYDIDVWPDRYTPPSTLRSRLSAVSSTPSYWDMRRFVSWGTISLNGYVESVDIISGKMIADDQGDAATTYNWTDDTISLISPTSSLSLSDSWYTGVFFVWNQSRGEWLEIRGSIGSVTIPRAAWTDNPEYVPGETITFFNAIQDSRLGSLYGATMGALNAKNGLQNPLTSNRYPVIQHLVNRPQFPATTSDFSNVKRFFYKVTPRASNYYYGYMDHASKASPVRSHDIRRPYMIRVGSGGLDFSKETLNSESVQTVTIRNIGSAGGWVKVLGLNNYNTTSVSGTPVQDPIYAYFIAAGDELTIELKSRSFEQGYQLYNGVEFNTQFGIYYGGTDGYQNHYDILANQNTGLQAWTTPYTGYKFRIQPRAAGAMSIIETPLKIREYKQTPVPGYYDYPFEGSYRWSFGNPANAHYWPEHFNSYVFHWWAGDIPVKYYVPPTTSTGGWQVGQVGTVGT